MEQLTTQLNSLVDGWLQVKSSRTIAALSRVSGVGESTLRRLKNNNVAPSSTNFIRIILATSETENVPDAYRFYKNKNKAIAEILEKEFPYLVNIDETLPVHKVSTQFLTSEMYIAYELIRIKNGMSANELEKLFSFKILSEIEKLKKADLVVETNGFLYTTNTNKLEVTSTLNVPSKLIAQFHKPNSLCNFVADSVLNVNDVGYNQIQELMNDMYDKIQRIAQANKGDVPMFTVLAMDTLLAKCPFSDDVKEEIYE